MSKCEYGELTYNTILMTDIDECLEDPCHSNATCSNTDGSYSCSCNTGYSGNGFSCTGNVYYKDI